MKKIIIAYQRHHAEWYIQNVLQQSPTKFLIIVEAFQLNGLERGTDIVFVRERHYTASSFEHEKNVANP